jgi:hypothetical protein
VTALAGSASERREHLASFGEHLASFREYLPSFREHLASFREHSASFREHLASFREDSASSVVWSRCFDALRKGKAPDISPEFKYIDQNDEALQEGL